MPEASCLIGWLCLSHMVRGVCGSKDCIQSFLRSLPDLLVWNVAFERVRFASIVQKLPETAHCRVQNQQQGCYPVNWQTEQPRKPG